MNSLKRTRFSRHFGVVLFFLLLSAVYPSHGEARAIGEATLHLSTERAEDANGTASNERHLRIGLATGWTSLIDEDQSIGYGLSVRTERGLQNSSELFGYGFGVFLGWYFGDFSVRFDYIAIAALNANNGFVETAFSEGSGLSLQARWLHWFANGKSALGPAFAFEQMRYGRSRVGSLPENQNSRTVESFTPGLAAIFLF